MWLPLMLFSLTPPSMLSDWVDLPRSLLVVSSVSGTRKISRSKVNSWASLSSSLTRRIPSYMDSFLPVALLITVRPCEWVQLSESPALKWQDEVSTSTGWTTTRQSVTNNFARLEISTCSSPALPPSKEIEQSGATLHCNRCFNSNITGVINQAIADNMYRVEILVDDGNNYAIVVVLNKEMLKLTKQDAATLFLNEVNSGGDGKLPQCIEELEGQTFIFHIHVSPSNSASSHCPFTVSAISGKITTEDFNNNETPYAVREFSEASTSASPINTSTVEVEQGGRKDARE
ncbi:hypothetical protein Bca4012_077032 [Brassica carinata]